MAETLDAARIWARDWLFASALPLWWEAGADRTHGGFHDRLDQDAKPVALPKRLRVQARQIFVYAEAGRLGWQGAWREAIAHGLDFMLGAYARPDGLFRSAVHPDGTSAVEDVDLYDQAFVMFGLAAAYQAQDRPPALLARAEHLLATLQARLAHPTAGFEEASPRRLPLRSNPHMHMLEALLAWTQAGGGDLFALKAREIVNLATARLIDADTGAVGEYYDGDWRFARPPEGEIREPGHQFEWSYLLDLAARILGGDHRRASDRLWRFGAAHGVRDGRAIFSTDAQGTPIDGSSRLWAQTERLRTMLVLAPGAAEADRGAMRNAALESIATVQHFLDVPIRGLWRDRISADGTMVDEPAPASSFYHIVTGLLPLITDAAG